MAKRRLPPSVPGGDPLAGVELEGFTVGSWVPSSDGTGTPLAVAIAIHTKQYGDLVLKIKSPRAVDEMIQLLLRYKREVWPDAR